MEPMTLTYYLIPFAVSFALSLALTPVVRRLALRWGQVAVPKDDRWHRKETALLGGVGIFLSMLSVWACTAFNLGWQVYGGPYVAVVLCSTAIFLLGLADDLFDMDPQHKLAGQIVIASVLVFFGPRLDWVHSQTLDLFLSILWVVGISNAFNLLDNMDGLAAGIALIAGAFLSLFIFLSPDSTVNAESLLLLCSVYVGAVLGFLIYNFNPASIFMGDSGSLFLGFMLACLTILGEPSQISGGNFLKMLSVIGIPVLILFIPILDTGFVSLMRKFFHRQISQGGKDHSSHRLVAIGFSERKAVLVLYLFAAISGMIALGVTRFSTGVSIVIIAFYLLFVLFFWVYLGKVKVYEEESIFAEKSKRGLTPVLIDITYRRRLFEVVLDFVLITVAYYSAYLLRFGGHLERNFDFFLKSLPILTACQMLSFYVLGVYRGVWESTGVRDLAVYLKAITAGTVLTVLILLGIYRFESFSRAVFAIYWVLMLIMVSLSRLSFRLLDEGIVRRKKQGTPTLIYGAGVGGQMALKEIETNRELDLKPVGFIDDKGRIHGRKVQGYPVLGGYDDLKSIISKYGIEIIIISFREGGEERKNEVRRLCSSMRAEVDVRRMKLVIS